MTAFKLSGLPVEIVSSPMHLETDNLLKRLSTFEEANPQRRRDEQAEPENISQFIYFTVPQHLMENLWLGEIPQLMGQEVEQNGGGDTKNWTTLETLAAFLMTANSAFEQIDQVMVHIGSPSENEEEHEKAEIFDIIKAQLGADQFVDPMMIAWLNIDDHSHFVSLEMVINPTKIADKVSAPDVSHYDLELEILPGEGVMWSSNTLKVAEATMLQEMTAKLLVLSGLRRCA